MAATRRVVSQPPRPSPSASSEERKNAIRARAGSEVRVVCGNHATAAAHARPEQVLNVQVPSASDLETRIGIADGMPRVLPHTRPPSVSTYVNESFRQCLGPMAPTDNYAGCSCACLYRCLHTCLKHVYPHARPDQVLDVQVPSSIPIERSIERSIEHSVEHSVECSVEHSIEHSIECSVQLGCQHSRLALLCTDMSVDMSTDMPNRYAPWLMPPNFRKLSSIRLTSARPCSYPT